MIKSGVSKIQFVGQIWPVELYDSACSAGLDWPRVLPALCAACSAHANCNHMHIVCATLSCCTACSVQAWGMDFVAVVGWSGSCTACTKLALCTGSLCTRFGPQVGPAPFIHYEGPDEFDTSDFKPTSHFLALAIQQAVRTLPTSPVETGPLGNQMYKSPED